MKKLKIMSIFECFFVGIDFLTEIIKKNIITVFIVKNTRECIIYFTHSMLDLRPL